jgi:hypothetical protein
MTSVQKIEEWVGVELFALISEVGEEGSPERAAFAKKMSSPRMINAMLAAFLLREDPSMTPTKAGHLVSTASLLATTSTAVTEALQRFFEVQDEAPTGPKEADPSPTNG